jgi:hypothetical protein
MSKHVSADQKLHTTPAPKAKRQPAAGSPNNPMAPPKGTNANNQYR